MDKTNESLSNIPKESVGVASSRVDNFDMCEAPSTECPPQYPTQTVHPMPATSTLICDSQENSVKTYVLDTNILLTSPYSIYSFDEHNVVVTDVTLEELDRIKMEEGSERGRNAKEATKAMDELRQFGHLLSGVQLPFGGGVFRIATAPAFQVKDKIPKSWDMRKADNQILYVCLGLIAEGVNPILVTNDTNMRVKADVIDIAVEEYRTEQVAQLDKQYSGRCKIVVPDKIVDQFYKDECLDMTQIVSVNNSEEKYDFTPNEFALIVSEENKQHSALGRYDGNTFRPLRFINHTPRGVLPRNVGQKFAQEALMQGIENAPLVILKGPAGTAKTFYSLACGLEYVLGDKLNSPYRRILVSRPNVKFDEDIGYLKGSEEDKIGPLTRPIFDNLEQLTRADADKRRESSQTYMQYLFDDGYIVAQALAFMRGRSIVDTWVIIDEAQNMTPSQAFGIISRAGKNCKIILAGDPEQVDNPHLNSRTNGLSYASEMMKGSPLCWQVSFTEDECERSPLAFEAIMRMSPKGMKKK